MKDFSKKTEVEYFPTIQYDNNKTLVNTFIYSVDDKLYVISIHVHSCGNMEILQLLIISWQFKNSQNSSHFDETATKNYNNEKIDEIEEDLTAEFINCQLNALGFPSPLTIDGNPENNSKIIECIALLLRQSRVI